MALREGEERSETCNFGWQEEDKGSENPRAARILAPSGKPGRCGDQDEALVAPWWTPVWAQRTRNAEMTERSAV